MIPELIRGGIGDSRILNFDGWIEEKLFLRDSLIG